jgi:hypothetical protein
VRRDSISGQIYGKHIIENIIVYYNCLAKCMAWGKIEQWMQRSFET